MSARVRTPRTGLTSDNCFSESPLTRAGALEHASMDTEQIEQIEYGRFDDLQRRFGIRRSKAYELIDAGKIKSVAVRKKGSRAGIRLINFNSVREFLRENEAHG